MVDMETGTPFKDTLWSSFRPDRFGIDYRHKALATII